MNLSDDLHIKTCIHFSSIIKEHLTESIFFFNCSIKFQKMEAFHFKLNFFFTFCSVSRENNFKIKNQHRSLHWVKASTMGFTEISLPDVQRFCFNPTSPSCFKWQYCASAGSPNEMPASCSVFFWWRNFAIW